MTVWIFNSIWTSTILHIFWNINGLLNKGGMGNDDVS